MDNQSRFPLKQALLGFLIQGPTHGYALHQRAENELGRIWYMGISNIYGILKRLEQAGQVESTFSSQKSHPPRKVYHITPVGREIFLDWVQRPVPTIRDMRVEFLAKLYFFHTLDMEGAQKLIAAQETICRKQIERLEQRTDGCDFNRLVFDFRRRRIKASLDWLQVCKKEYTQ